MANKSSSKIMNKFPSGGRSIKTSVRKESATIVDKNRPEGQKYRFPMPDKTHARAALQDLPKAKGLSDDEKAKIRSRANQMLHGSDSEPSPRERRMKTMANRANG